MPGKKKSILDSFLGSSLKEAAQLLSGKAERKEASISGSQVSQPSTQPESQQVYVLNFNEALLYGALAENVGCFTTVRRIAEVLGRSEHTMRKCLRRLARMGLVEYEVTNLRTQQGIRILRVRRVRVSVIQGKEEVVRKLKQTPLQEIALDRQMREKQIFTEKDL